MRAGLIPREAVTTRAVYLSPRAMVDSMRSCERARRRAMAARIDGSDGRLSLISVVMVIPSPKVLYGRFLSGQQRGRRGRLCGDSLTPTSCEISGVQPSLQVLPIQQPHTCLVQFDH